ncbi:phage tail length tape measure family protein [Phenylobacterium conjunctum]|uniref:Phage tail length tape measure family protein n=1 Tax=Phenylobacterium conjunctum TaxID=1298959 RepID=A0ABW3SYR4_9CAUL
MPDIASLVVKVDATQAQGASAALERVAAAGGRAEAQAGRLGSSSARAASSLAEMGQAVREADAAMSEMVRETARVVQAQTEIATGWEGVAAAWHENDFVREYQTATGALDKSRGAAKLTANEMLNLSRQFSDIGVTAAMGMNPLMILVQQGPQIADTLSLAAQRGVSASEAFKIMAAEAWGAVAPIAPFVAGAAALAAVLGGGLLIATHEINKANGDLTKGLGLTEKQMEKVKNKGVTMGDVLKGTFKYVAESLSREFAPQLEWMHKALSATYQFMLNATKAAISAIVGAWGGVGAAISAAFKGQDMGVAFVEGYQKAVAGLPKMYADLSASIVGVAQARIKEEAGTSKATKALKDHTKAVKEAVAANGNLVDGIVEADMSKAHWMIDEIKVASVDGLSNIAAQASKSWGEAMTNDEAAFNASLDGMKDSFRNFFEQIVVEGKANWKSLLGSLLNNWQAAFEKMQTSTGLLSKGLGLVVSSLGKAAGSVSTSVGTAIGQAAGLGTGNGTADMLLGVGGAAVGTMFAGTSANLALAGTVGTALGAGTLGAGVATLLSSAAVLGPIAAIAALAVGTLFKSKPSNNGALATFNGDTFDISGSKRTDETTQMAQAAANGILQGQSILQAAGIKLATTVKSIDIGTRDATDIILSDGRALTSAVGDAAAAAETALKGILQGATYASDAQKKLVESMLAAGKGFDAIAQSLQDYQAAQGFTDNIVAQIKAITDPSGAELDQLLASQKAQRDSLKGLADAGYLTADQFAEASKQLGILEGLQLDNLFKGMAGAGGALATKVDEARQSLSDAYDAQSQSLKDLIGRFSALSDSLRKFRASLDTSGLGGLSPEDRYASTKSAFEDVARRAKLGDETALGQLQDVSQAYLEASKDYYASTEPYFRDLAAVKEALQGAQDTADRTVANAEAQLTELQKMVTGLLDVKAATLTVADAVKALNGALAAQAAALQAAQARLEVSTSTSATASTFNGAGYLSANPDVAAAYQDYLAGTGPYSWAYSAGLTAEQFAKAHYDMQGQSEGRTGYATGAVVTRPISLGDSGVAGEAGPEGILPLANVNGRLGVRASINQGSDQETKDLLRQILTEMRASNTLGSAAAKQTLDKLDALAANGEAQIRKLARQ